MPADLSSPQAFRDARLASGATIQQLAAAITDLAHRQGDEDFSLTQQAISWFENGNAKQRPRWLRYAIQVLERGTRSLNHESDQPASSKSGLVAIQQIDLAYGMGATFADGPVKVELLEFPRVWVEAITSSPPAMLTWARGRGDSMAPTIHDGDLVLLDRSQTRVLERDALWAFTIGETGAIKRLRVKGDRMVILSDNAAVPTDEEPLEYVNVVARVVFVGRRT